MARIHGRFNPKGVFVDKDGNPVTLVPSEIGEGQALSEEEVESLIDSLNRLSERIKNGESINEGEANNILKSASKALGKASGGNTGLSKELVDKLKEALDKLSEATK